MIIIPSNVNKTHKSIDRNDNYTQNVCVMHFIYT